MHMTHAPNINNTFQSYPRIGTKLFFPSVSLPGKQHFPSHYTGSLLPEAVIKAIYHHLCSVSSPPTTITPTRHAPMFLCLTSLSWAGYPYSGCFGVVYLKPVEYMPPFCIYTLYSGFNKQHRNCNQGPYTSLHSIAPCSETVLKQKLFELLSEFWSLVAISPPNDLFPTAHSEPHTCWACVCLLEKVKDNSELYL